jgi:hypothetical protein
MAPQYGPHRWSAGYHDDGTNEALRGTTFLVKDLAGARFVDCDLTGVKIVDSWLVGVDISGFVGGLTINGVEVTGYVQAELDRRHPERVQLREMRTADDYRAMWATVEGLWAGALARAERLDEPARHARVDSEWSLAETLRHLIFIADSWAARTVLDEPTPYHRIGLPQTAYPPKDASALGIDLGADPSWAEVLEVRAERTALVRGLIDGLTDDDLTRPVTRSPAPGYPDEERTVGGCLEVVMDEECEHYRFATRDLAVLEAGPPRQ